MSGHCRVNVCDIDPTMTRHWDHIQFRTSRGEAVSVLHVNVLVSILPACTGLADSAQCLQWLQERKRNEGRNLRRRVAISTSERSVMMNVWLQTVRPGHYLNTEIFSRSNGRESAAWMEGHAPITAVPLSGCPVGGPPISHRCPTRAARRTPVAVPLPRTAPQSAFDVEQCHSFSRPIGFFFNQRPSHHLLFYYAFRGSQTCFA